MTKDSTVLSNSSKSVSKVLPCFQEEADTRMLLNTVLCTSSTTIKTVDTYVVVIAIAMLNSLPSVKELWIELRPKP